MNKLIKLEQPHGLGKVNLRWQRGSGGYLATSGADNTVAIFNRGGKLIERISLPSICMDFGWDRDGDMLAVISMYSSSLILWDSNTHRGHHLDCGLRDNLSCVLWSKTGHTLAVATAKGNVCIYNHSTNKRVPILGKHTKAIVCGTWNVDNLLALGSEDCTISISNIEGDTLKIITVRAEPSLIQFSEMKLDERCPGENTVSVIVGHKTLFLYNLQDPENPTELAFQSRYGNIVSYQWFGDGYVLIGFSEGYLISISTHVKEIGAELFQRKNHSERLTDVALSINVGKVATCGDNNVKVYEMGNLPEEVEVVTIDEDNGVEKLAWSEDGQLLAVSTTYGSVLVFLSKLPMLSSSYMNCVCVLTTLSQITVHLLPFQKNKRSEPVILETDIEPSFLCVGPFHLTVTMNNRTWFYKLGTRARTDEPGLFSLKNPKFLFDREYLSNIKSVRLNADFVSVLFEGRVHLHQIEEEAGDDKNDREMKIFPNDNENVKIVDHNLTPEFFVYATNLGHIRYFSLEEWKLASEFQYNEPVKSIYTNIDGTKCLFVDGKNEGHLYNPANDTTLKIPEFPTSVKGALWDISPNQKHIFIVYDSKTVYTYVYLRESIYGASIQFVGETKLPNALVPLLMNKGELYCENKLGKLPHFVLNTHQTSASLMKQDEKTSLENSLRKHLALFRYAEAWNLCSVIDSKDCWRKLALTALTNLHIDKETLNLNLLVTVEYYDLILYICVLTVAIEVYSHIQDVGMVLSLKSLKYVEDMKLLAGHVAKFIGEFDRAQELYLESDDPVEALNMRQDILQWDVALQLAETLAPGKIPYICKEYGQQLELKGRYSDALNYYERGFGGNDSLDDKQLLSCQAGIARTAIRCGDYQRGMKIATEATVANKQLRNECAELFENVKKLNEAAQLYELAENYNQAASCYIRLKNWTKVGSVLPMVSSSKIYSQFAKAMEAIGNYKKAINAYELARDYDSVIRIMLDRLNDVQEAVRVVQETRSIEGAKLVARHFRKIGNFVSAVKFLIMSTCYEEAYKLAAEHDQLELYGDLLVEELPDGEIRNEFSSLGAYFEDKKNLLLAGKYYYHGKQYKKAIKHLLAAAKEDPANEEALSLIIDVVAASQDGALTNRVIELLLGEADGEARDPKFLFRLYMAKREYLDAAKTAVIIAQEEQINGNYRQAHCTLFKMCCELKSNSLKISSEMMSSLMLLHSYILATICVKLGDHVKAALLLVRVADNISKFPAHVVPILTSTVVECHRANMKLSAFKFASVLMKSEYKEQMADKYRKRIEGIIRKGPRGDQLVDDVRLDATPCPICDKLLTCTQLNCTGCQSTLPFCIATGWHVTKENLTSCPSCNFAALRSEFIEILKVLKRCPMCNENINANELPPMQDIKQYFDS